ncbi:MAG TPA: CoB--CoM heterodisulfide reductase iron-sulfur subunit A family protein, partial [Anaerolineae bacterium]|nr:CoB--CoM heterodisulfide reductase iron-sulfur subunit A family protein [Anaerolineae bacterium]
QHPNIEILTDSTVVEVKGQPGDFTVQVHRRPRYVDPGRCINCDECAQVCPVELTDEFQLGLSRRKAAYKPAVRSAPNAYLIEKGPYCEPCRKCEQVCPTHAIHLDEEARFEEIRVGAVILTAGYRLYDPAPAEELGYGRYPNVVTGLQFERMTSRSGPTEGEVRRPSDGKPPERIAWLQCVGSRDQEHPYCSSICCMYASKEAVLAKERLPDVECEVFIMDERAFGKEYTAYFEQSKALWGVQYTRSRISAIKEDPHSRDLVLYYEDNQGTLRRKTFDMVVLSVGSEPPTGAAELAAGFQIELNDYGFCRTDKFEPLDTSRPGVFVAGAFATPKEMSETVIDASGAAARCMALLPPSRGAATGADEPPERDVSGEEPRVGVFACLCHPTIDEVVDVEGVLAFAERLPGVVHTQALAYGCLPEGEAALRQAIGEHNLNRVVIGACTPRTHLAFFERAIRQEGLNPHLLEFVSLRENCAWVHRDDPAGATRKAKEEMRVAAARARHLQPYHKETREVRPSALVIGGGLAGMTAALSIADNGYPVTLIEKEGDLGGHLRHLYRTVEGPNPQDLLHSLVRRVQEHERITLHQHTEVLALEGSVGHFRAQLLTRNGGSPHRWEEEVGVAVVATGAREFQGEIYLYGQHPRVATQSELEQRLAEDADSIRKMDQVVMIQCVHPPEQGDFYCSRICCTTAIKNALRIKALNPDCQVFILYKELMTYGFREQYYTQAREQGVIFIRYEEDAPPQVTAHGDKVEVQTREGVLGQDLILRPDLLALSMPVLPAEGNRALAQALGVPLSPEGFFQENDLKLRPMDFSREGIFLAGMAHYPKFMEETIAQALAASARAMTYLSKDRLAVGETIAVVEQSKCVGCLTCVRTCPFGVPRIDPQAVGVGAIMGAAYIDPSRCTGCGTCTSECPANAIQLRHYRDDQLVLTEEPILGQWQV